MAYYVNIHTHKIRGKSIELINLSGSYLPLNTNYLSFGLHPWDIEKVDEEETINYLERLCNEKKIIAVGEIGLDRAIETPVEKQKAIFLRQIEIANEYNLPIIIHSVRTNSDLLEIKNKLKASSIWIFHGFKGNLQEANQLIDKQCFLSFGKALFHHKKTQEVLLNISLDYVFFETDDSDEKILTIYEKAAEILDICIEELKEKIYSNFNSVFGLQ